MRTFACLAAMAALAFSPIATAQTAPGKKVLNSPDDFSIATPPAGCSWSIGHSNDGKVGYATCSSQQVYDDSFQLGPKLVGECKPVAKGVECAISSKKS